MGASSRRDSFGWSYPNRGLEAAPTISHLMPSSSIASLMALVMASDSLAPIPAACKLQISEFCKKLHLKIPPGPPFSGKRAWRDSEVGKLNKTHLPLRSLAKPWARLPEKGGLRGILMGCWTTQFSNRTTLSQHSASKIDPSSMDIAASSP